MRTVTYFSRLTTVPMTALRVVRWAAISAGVSALGGAIFGMLFAGFMILFRVESFGFFGTTSYFAVSGMVAGAVLGVWGALLDIEAPAEPTELAPRIVKTQKNRFADIDPGAKPRPSQQRNRLAELSRTDLRNVSSMATPDPSRN